MKLIVFDGEGDLGKSHFVVDEKKHCVFVAHILIACHYGLLQIHSVHL